jgi:hypothetical protein
MMGNDSVVVVSTTDTPEQIAEAFGAQAPASPVTNPPAPPASPDASSSAPKGTSTDGQAAVPADLSGDEEAAAEAADAVAAETDPVGSATRRLSRREKRIAQLRGQIGDRDRYINYLLEQIRGGSGTPQIEAVAPKAPAAPAPAAAPVAPASPDAAAAFPVPADSDPTDPRPKPEAFELDSDYAVALAAWASRRQFAELRAAEANRIAEQSRIREADETRARFKTRADELRQTHADYDAVTQREDLVISVPVAAFIQNDPDGAEVAYFLGKNPDVCREVSAVTDELHGYVVGDDEALRQRALVAIGQAVGLLKSQMVAARTSGPAPSAPKNVPRIPEPIQPVGGGSAASSVADDRADYQAYKAKRTRENPALALRP